MKKEFIELLGNTFINWEDNSPELQWDTIEDILADENMEIIPFTKQEFKEFIDKEIKWVTEHKTSMTKGDKEFFIKGILHAYHLFTILYNGECYVTSDKLIERKTV